MHVSSHLRHAPGRALGLAVLLIASLLIAISASQSQPAAAPVARIESALAAVGTGSAFPVGAQGRRTALPDHWFRTNPQHEGSMWYRTPFKFAGASLPDELLALY